LEVLLFRDLALLDIADSREVDTRRHAPQIGKCAAVTDRKRDRKLQLAAIAAGALWCGQLSWRL
jgi:hypothetical protein